MAREVLRSCDSSQTELMHSVTLRGGEKRKETTQEQPRNRKTTVLIDVWEVLSVGKVTRS